MRSRPSLGARLFRALLRLLPTDFRGDFGDAMAADVDGARHQGAGFWRREISSVLVAIAREHIDALRQDVKYALRTMRRTPGFTTMAVLMLALGTGVNAAMFSIVDAVVLRSPFIRPAELVQVLTAVEGRETWAISADAYNHLARAPGPLVAVGAFSNGMHVLTGLGDPINLGDIECVSSDMFTVLGTAPWLGRTFGAADDQPGAPPTIVLSYNFWRHLGGSAALVGSSLTINRMPVTVVGVMPNGFAGPLARSDVQGWMPRNRPVQSAENSGCRQGAVTVFARLPAGLSPAAARLALPGFTLAPLEPSNDMRGPFTVMMVAVACVLLIACLNVGGLQMERTLSRRREMALRLALGASRGRLVRQALTENLLLAFVGAAAGIVAAQFTLRMIVSTLPVNVPYLDQIEVNSRVLVATIGSAAIVGLIAGFLPIAEMRRVAPARDLTDGARSSERRGGWGRRALVVTEIALSIVVLIGAALMIQTFLTLRPSQPGFDPDGKWVMTVRTRGETPDASARFFGQLIERLQTTSAIRGVSAASTFPMSGTSAYAEMTLNNVTRNVFATYTMPDFFTLMKMPMVAGRMFSRDDTRGSMPVMLVNQMLAASIRPDGQVLGQRILMKSDIEPPVERTIVGIIANTRFSGVDTRSRSEVYIPYAQNPVVALRIVAEVWPGRDSEAAAQMRAAVRALRPELVVDPPESMGPRIRQRMGATPFAAWLLGVIAVLAVCLAAIGLMATIGWWVRQRTRELGVRVALGATRGRITALVLRQGMTIAGLGIALGCLAAMGLTRYLEGWIYGVTPLDATTFAGCAVLMLAVAVSAIYVPVRRATAIDPVIALKAD